MQIPLTSLDWIEWGVFADWASEFRPKAEGFSRRVSHALRKMYLAGVDPKCALAFRGVYGRDRWLLYSRLHPSCRPVSDPDPTKVYVRHFNWQLTFNDPFGMMCVGEWRWVTPNEEKRLRVTQPSVAGYFSSDVVPKLCPANLHEPERHVRLCMKFYKVVIRRATGIPESVIGGVHG